MKTNCQNIILQKNYLLEEKHPILGFLLALGEEDLTKIVAHKVATNLVYTMS